MDRFELVSEYKPTGDQPQAIADLVNGFKEGNQCETLLGVTGSGKTFTKANVNQQISQRLSLHTIKLWLHSFTASSRNFFRTTQWNTLSPTIRGRKK